MGRAQRTMSVPGKKEGGNIIYRNGKAGSREGKATRSMIQ